MIFNTEIKLFLYFIIFYVCLLRNKIKYLAIFIFHLLVLHFYFYRYFPSLRRQFRQLFDNEKSNSHLRLNTIWNFNECMLEWNWEILKIIFLSIVKLGLKCSSIHDLIWDKRNLIIHPVGVQRINSLKWLENRFQIVFIVR